ncbi:PAS domain-containing sensor histidine kinase [Polycladidibacter hongkongensis]|uniref:PAS domain-containing sensor histidine kinase n=1 Tax=Polycladidibacter hongkongensis TaxID=1647556 RepID=UPI0009EACCB8|nr:PAS domain-containing sensor histidine kinase [Pseudovibrio hongkongensis]
MPLNRQGRVHACCAQLVRLRQQISTGQALKRVWVLLLAATSLPAHAAETQPSAAPLLVVSLAVLGGALLFAGLVARSNLRLRAQLAKQSMQQTKEARLHSSSVDYLQSLLETEDCLMLVWDHPQAAPKLLGHAIRNAEVPIEARQIIAFEDWLEGTSAEALRAYLRHLHGHGEAFRATLTTLDGTYLEALGRTAGAALVLRLRDLTDDRQLSARLRENNVLLRHQQASLRNLLDAMPGPAWQRDRYGKLVWVNQAYVEAVDARTRKQTLEGATELLDAKGRERLSLMRDASGLFSAPMPVVAAGERRVFDITDVRSEDGAAGLAVDISELERVQQQLRRTLESHRRTLDLLQTAVAVFGADKRLQFYNAAFAQLFGMEEALLQSSPEEGALLDAMRAARKLPEQADYRLWRAKHLEAYQSLEPQENWWYLPDGQALRVIVSPHPQGGVTYIYENVTERLNLESRYNALMSVQGETLENLSEAVAVFGSNGRLRLSNPAFASLLRLKETDLEGEPHISALVLRAKPHFTKPNKWEHLSSGITGLDDTRTHTQGRMERTDGVVTDYALLPLPDGGTLVNFVDVTASVNIQRALTEKNEALQKADQLKNAFIEHVNYELRSPLTNIIGFSQLLADPIFGALTNKQREYVSHIESSSEALLSIINNILDLATLDAGIMKLDLDDVDIKAAVDEAVQGLQDRLLEGNIQIETVFSPNLGSMRADARRIRQILFNLLSNAVRHSVNGSKVEISCKRLSAGVVIKVSDHGSGIPENMVEEVFSRFVSQEGDGGKQGAGLGLPIVKSFVELHGGSVEIETSEGMGTTVICRFPLQPNTNSLDAAE